MEVLYHTGYVYMASHQCESSEMSYKTLLSF